MAHGGFSEEDMDLLVARYTDARGDVNYRALHEDVTRVTDASNVNFPTSNFVVHPDSTNWTLEDLVAEDKIQAKVVEKRIRMRDYFQDFDHLRKGFCTPGQVRTVLSLLNVEVWFGLARVVFTD